MTLIDICINNLLRMKEACEHEMILDDVNENRIRVLERKRRVFTYLYKRLKRFESSHNKHSRMNYS